MGQFYLLFMRPFGFRQDTTFLARSSGNNL